jgi:hypothetical protein
MSRDPMDCFYTPRATCRQELQPVSVRGAKRIRDQRFRGDALAFIRFHKFIS